MERLIWKNGKIVPESEAVVSVYDSAMMFGDCVFEMTRSFNGKQFRLREHLERLFRSAAHVRIPMDYDIDELEVACFETQDANKFAPDDEHRLMINVTRGTLPMYEDTGRTGTNVTICDFPLRWTVAGMGKLFDDGINAVTPSQRAIPAHLLDPKVKSRSRLHYLMANIQASRFIGDNNWPLLFDENGFATEGTGANFFIYGEVPWYIDFKMLRTPHHDNVLNGISREYIEDLDQNTAADDINETDICEASEAFFTATPFCMLPVVSINEHLIGDGKVGPKYKSLLRKWSENVGVDIKGQIQAWDKGGKEGPSAYKFK